MNLKVRVLSVLYQVYGVLGILFTHHALCLSRRAAMRLVGIGIGDPKLKMLFEFCDWLNGLKS